MSKNIRIAPRSAPTITLSIVAAIFLTFSTDAAESWPQFRGSLYGFAPGANPPTELAPEKAIWKTSLHEGSSSPCVWENSIFLTDANRASLELEAICLNRASGDVQWRRSIKAEKLERVHEVNTPAAPTPVTDGKTVVVYFGSLGLVAYDFQGKELWRTRLPLARAQRGFGTGVSPLLVKGRIFLPLELGNDSYMAAYNLEDGKEIWRTLRLFHGTWATPIHFQENGADRVGQVSSGRFVAYDWTDGKEIWWLDGIANQVCATPVAKDGIIYISSAGVLGERAAITIPEPFDKARAQYDANNDGLVQFTEIPEKELFAKRGNSDGAGDMPLRQAFGFFGKKKEDSFNAEQWEEIRKQFISFKESDMNKTSLRAVRVGGKGDAKGHILWDESRGVPEIPSALLVKGRLYLIRNGGILTCRDAATGKLLFDERIGAAGGYYASPVATDDHIYLASDTGAITVVRASDKLEVISRTTLGERVHATPAICGSSIYIRSQNTLWAFNR
jgi:outer membrane protein assembly factor BamB